MSEYSKVSFPATSFNTGLDMLGSAKVCIVVVSELTGSIFKQITLYDLGISLDVNQCGSLCPHFDDICSQSCYFSGNMGSTWA